MSMAAGEVRRLGVVGAGTMGSGIALAALYAGLEVVLQDIDSQSLDRAGAYITRFLARKGLQAYGSLLTLAGTLDTLREVDFVIEAAVEDLALKRGLFEQLDGLCAPHVTLATNTSTLPVTAIAAAAAHPERVAGMHFFNPAAVLPLVEVVRGAQTSERTVAAVIGLAERLGKTPVLVEDRPGFIVNRVARPYYAEALRLAGEGAATPGEIDWIMESAAGFPMGPFRLMDLIGVDINYAAMLSLYEQSFGEPRYRPHWIQQQMLHQGALGRKTGRGFYQYEHNQSLIDPLPAPVPVSLEGSAWLSAGTWTPGLAELFRASGLGIQGGAEGQMGGILIGVVCAGRDEGLRELAVEMDRRLPQDLPLFVQAVDTTVSEIAGWLANPERLVGLDGLFLARGACATLVAGPSMESGLRKKAEDLMGALGRSPVWIQDTPALVAPRVVGALANEASFAVLDGVAAPGTIDIAMRLGMNFPLGPVDWVRELGPHRVLAVLDHLFGEYHEGRYRASVLLRRWVRGGAPLDNRQ
jgi:3-hydroxybutyryl-CoA dehydrogenase